MSSYASLHLIRPDAATVNIDPENTRPYLRVESGMGANIVLSFESGYAAQQWLDAAGKALDAAYDAMPQIDEANAE